MKSIDDLLSLSHSKALLLAGVLVSSLICLQLSVDDSHSQWLVLKNSYFAKLTIPISYFSTFPSAYNQTFPPRAVPLVISYYHNPWEDDIVLFSQGFLNSAANYCSAQLDGQHVLYPISEKTTYAFRCAVPHADFGPLNNTVISLQLKDTTILDSAVRFVTPRLIRRGPPPLPKRSVCAVTQFKNLAPDLRDWLSYHHKIGISHFYLYDNNSTDFPAEIVDSLPYAERIFWPFYKSQQQSFAHGALLTSNFCDWTVFLDVDEYIFPASSSDSNSYNVKKYLPTSKFISQVCLYSKVYGSSGMVIPPPDTSMVDLYIHRPPEPQCWELHPKCFVRPKDASLYTKIHFFMIKTLGNEAEIVDNGEQATKDLPPRTVYLKREDIHLNHYKLRSWKDFIVKFGGRNGPVQDWPTPDDLSVDAPPRFWASGHVDVKNATVEDTALKKFKTRIMEEPLVDSPTTI